MVLDLMINFSVEEEWEKDSPPSPGMGVQTLQLRTRRFCQGLLRWIKRGQVPATTFHRFAELPDELQLMIIQYAAWQPRAVEIKWLAKSDYVPGDPNIAPPLPNPWNMLTVSRKFRDEALKVRPFAFPMYQRDKISPPRIPFNWDMDILMIPQYYLQDPAIWIKDLEKLKKICIIWEGPFNMRLARRIAQLPNLETSAKLIHRSSPEYYRGLHRCYYTKTGPFCELEKANALQLYRMVRRATRKHRARPLPHNTLHIRPWRITRTHPLLKPMPWLPRRFIPTQLRERLIKISDQVRIYKDARIPWMVSTRAWALYRWWRMTKDDRKYLKATIWGFIFRWWLRMLEDFLGRPLQDWYEHLPHNIQRLKVGYGERSLIA